MHPFFKNINILFTACRGYSLPISIMSWFVPFIFALLQNGSVINGLIALLGIVILHMGTNIFDDAIDYTRELFEINKGIKKEFNFQKGKCICILENLITIKQAYLIAFCLFIISFGIGLYFLNLLGTKLLFIIIPSAIICILYPILGCLGLGEILVSLIFSPLIYSGVYFIMTGSFSSDILILSISTGLLAVAVLHNHMLLDYKYDTTNRKITLCRICKTENNALLLLKIIVFFAYLNLIIWIISGHLSVYYLLPLITIPNALILIKVMGIHIKNPDETIKQNILMGNLSAVKKVPDDQKNFILKFLLAENLLSSFTIVLCISVVINHFMLNN